MPRSVSGNYTLPLPPVVPNTVITSAWANTTTDDLALAMTNSLDRYGSGGMVAAFRLQDGIETLPAWAFNAETGTGMWRESTGVLSVSIQGAKVAEWTSAGFAVSGIIAVDNFVADAITGAVSVTSPTFVGGTFQSDAGEPITLTDDEASIVWRLGVEVPPGIVIGRATGSVLQLLCQGGFVHNNAVSGLEFFTNAFTPQGDNGGQLGNASKRWTDLFIGSGAVQIGATAPADVKFYAYAGGASNRFRSESSGGVVTEMQSSSGIQGLIGTISNHPMTVMANGSGWFTLKANSDIDYGSVSTGGGPVFSILTPTNTRGTIRFNNGTQVWNTSLKGDAGQNYYMIYNPSETVGVYMTPGASGWNNLSDMRHKTAWEELEGALDKVMTLHAGTFAWGADLDLPRDVGLLAQDVLPVLPEAVDTTAADRYGMRYTHIVPLLVKAVQELAAQVAGKRMPPPITL